MRIETFPASEHTWTEVKCKPSPFLFKTFLLKLSWELKISAFILFWLKPVPKQYLRGILDLWDMRLNRAAEEKTFFKFEYNCEDEDSWGHISHNADKEYTGMVF